MDNGRKRRERGALGLDPVLARALSALRTFESEREL